MTIMGSGWAALSWEPVAKRLVTTQIYDHQSNITQGGVPILVLDAWEHAFYLQYGPDKKSFFEAVWNIWNWMDVGQRFEKVRGARLSACAARPTVNSYRSGARRPLHSAATPGDPMIKKLAVPP